MAEKTPEKVLFLGLGYSDVAQESNLYTELVEELSLAGVDVRVVAPAQDMQHVGLRKEGGISVLRVPAGRLFDVGLVRKALNNLALPFRYFVVLREQNRAWQPQWIISPTPPITFTPLVWWLKRATGANAYLILRDIFPQNAVDLGLMSRFGFVYLFFRSLEKWTYAISDQIGCMSPGNERYVLALNPVVDPVKLHMLPNWIAEKHIVKKKLPSESLRIKWGVGKKDLLCVFGGNLGEPQQVIFLTEVANLLRDEPNIRMVIVGRGTERQLIQREIFERKLSNLTLRERLPKEEYQQLLSAADIGFILLNERFTIPNIPSRLTGYWAAGVAVLAATDTASDLNQSFLARFGGGAWVKMGDAQAFADKLRYFLKNRRVVAKMGERGQEAILQHFTAKKAAETVLRQMASVDR